LIYRFAPDFENRARNDESAAGYHSFPMAAPLATYQFTPGTLEETLEFLKRTRSELRMLRKVRIWKDKLHIIDVNKDYFEIQGIGYPDADIVPILQKLNTAFNPQTIHNATDLEYKEFDTGKRRPWAEDRVM
jgi:hypothetical protein